MTKGTDRILLVDDEQAVLDGLCRQHRKHYDLVPACGVEAGLRAVVGDGPFAVVVTDYKMPIMSGTQFLAKVKDHSPDMMRIMLTGQADLKTAIEAVNSGNIFRFLTKPCSPEIFRGCVNEAIEHRRLRNVERDLLEQTLRGSIAVLADVLALSNPWAFGRASRVRGLVRHVVETMKLDDGWQYETAALLSQIGCVTIPDDSVQKLAAGEELPTDQMAMISRHPEVARDLLARIPRLQAIGEMVYRQHGNDQPSDDPTVVLGGQILATALKFEERISIGATRKQALDALGEPKREREKEIFEALRTAKIPEAGDDARLISVRELGTGMVIQEDVRNVHGNLIVSRGHEVTEGSRQRLQNYAELGNLEKTEFRIHLPEVASDEAASDETATDEEAADTNTGGADGEISEAA